MLLHLLSAIFLSLLAIFPPSQSIAVRARSNHPLYKRQFQPALPQPWTVGPEQMCVEEEKQQCNSHSSQFQCSCPTPGSGGQNECLALLPRVERAEEQLLSIGIAFPLLGQFREDPERLFLEDLEMFTFIPREAILIYGRGCSPDGSAYQFQVGILESTCRHSPAKLRTLHPRIFLSNPLFMHHNALQIAYVRAN